MHETDEQLMARLRCHDEAALSELHRRHAPALLALATRVLHDTAAAQACVQDAFVDAWNTGARYDAKNGTVATWLVIITHRRALTLRRERTSRVSSTDGWNVTTHPPDLVDRVAAHHASHNLDTEERSLIELAFFQGSTHAELAALTGKPLEAVKTHLRSALSKLRTSRKDTERSD